MASIPFHIPSIPKPQITYNFQINNSNECPFLHHSLPASQDGSARPVHPAEAFDPLDFSHYPLPASSAGPVQPHLMESTTFRLVEDITGLRYLAAKLSLAEEFGVDLEQNCYRTFQGMTCLMQISTRAEDFIVDTLKLWSSVGKFLGKFFSDPSKKKVMHDATNDVIWLQRDFGIYVVNLFDTMQASKVLKLERNSLAFVLKYFCGVHVDKKYQCSDWRLRPLPSEMVKYAREDAHYLLYVYDLMREELVSGSTELGFEDPLGEVYKRSHNVCLRMYKKEFFDKETSYKRLHGVRKAELDARQIAIVAGLYEWRDRVAREEDESTGYVLPNEGLLEIAKKQPLNKGDLLELVGYSKPFVLRDVDKMVEIIWAAICVDAPKFEQVVEEFKKGVSVSARKVEQVVEELTKGVQVSEIAAQNRERRNLYYDEEKNMAYQEIEASTRMAFGPKRWIPSRPAYTSGFWVVHPNFGPSSFRAHKRCHCCPLKMFPGATA